MGEERVPQITVPTADNPQQMADILRELQLDVLDLLEALHNDRLRDWLRL